MRKLFSIIFLSLLFSHLCTESVAASSLNRLGVRTRQNNRQEFYDVVTQTPVLLRGNNYIRAKDYGTPEKPVWVGNTNFSLGQYNRTKNIQALDQMKQYRYNAVRIFVNRYDVGNKTGTGLSTEYMNNMVDFIKLANERKLYVFITFSGIPSYGKYQPSATNPNIEAPYHIWLLIPEYVQAKKKYVKDVINTMKEKGVPLETLIYTIENEPYFEMDKKPFSLTQGNITVANGQTYNMANTANDKNRIMEDSLLYYMDAVRQSIKEADPQALVGITVFSPITGRTQNSNWQIKTGKTFTQSSADFISINMYPGTGNINEEMAAFEMGTSKKPLVLSEFGAYPHIYGTIDRGAEAMRDMQVQTCRQYGFIGWFAYEWDTSDYDSFFRIYHVVEGSGAINIALAPLYRADPCKTENTAQATIAPTATRSPTPTKTPILGDINNNKKIDAADYNTLVANFGKTGASGWMPSDIIKNGKVDIFDYNIVVGNFGKTL